MSLVSSVPLIAVIDDDEAVRVSLDGLIRSYGYGVRLYESALAFLNCAERAAADCVISDVQMPGMTGIELKEALVASGSPTPVILISAFVDDISQARAEQAGVTCYLKKPFTGQGIIDCLNRALGLEATP